MTILSSILVPLDGSRFAEQALPLAAALARHTGATIRLALVHQSPPAPTTADTKHLYTSIEVALHRSEAEYLERTAAGLRQALGDGEVAHVVLADVGTPGPGPALEQFAQERDTALVVMSTHGRGGLQRTWLGSVADYLVRSLAIPVLLVRPTEAATPGPLPGTGPRTRILVALDGSEQGESVLEPAVELARALGAEVWLVHVVQPVVIPVDAQVPMNLGYDSDLTELQRKQAEDYLADLAEDVRAAGVPVSRAAVLGSSVAETLLDLTRAEDVGLIALATHGRGGLPRLLLGSVADKLVRGAERPVLVLRPPRVRGGWRARQRGREEPHGASVG